MSITILEKFEPGYMELQPSKPSYPARKVPVMWLPNIFIQRGQTIGQQTSTSKFGAYASGNSDGTQTPKGFSAYSFNTDANGLVYYVMGSGSGVSGSAINPIGATYRATPNQTSVIFICGCFNQNDLIGFDSNAQTILKSITMPDGDYMIAGS